MEMCYDGTLAMPSSYTVMSEEEMTYLEGGYWYKKNFSSKANIAYKNLMDGGNAAWALALGGIVGGAALAGPYGAVAGLGIGATVFAQWADAYYAAAESLYKYRTNSKKTVKYYEALSGIKAYMTVKITSIK